MKTILITLALMLTTTGLRAQDELDFTFASAETSVEAPQEERMVRSQFHTSVIRAARNNVKNGTMTRRDFRRLRVAMISPAFRAEAENLAVIQMVFSDSENVPLNADGVIDMASIDWDAIIAFLEKLIPFILQLLEIFGGLG